MTQPTAPASPKPAAQAQPPIRLIVGLGNPGPNYDDTRHNAGFWFVDRHAGPGRMRMDTKYFGEVAKLEGQNLWLLKPMTFMNRSGQAVAALSRFYRIDPSEMLVVHDELDLPPGQARLKRGGGTGGHNGLKDIQAQCGTPNFWRLRIGIGHPRNLAPGKEVANFVLERPRREEQTVIDAAIDRALNVLPDLIAGRFEQAMQTLHRDA